MLEETRTCYATSRDGIRWEKPSLDVVPGTNIVFQRSTDSNTTVWLDLAEADPSRRYKLFETSHKRGWSMAVFFSADGIHWGAAQGRGLPSSDRSTAFYNPFRGVWVYSVKYTVPVAPVTYPPATDVVRVRFYREHPDPVAGVTWSGADLIPWVAADRLDLRHADHNVQPQLYNLDAVAYESLLLGLFTIWRGQPAAKTATARPKINEVVLGFSRDGFHWYRPCRTAFVPVSAQPDAWNWGNVQSAGGGCLVVGEELRFYVSGRGAGQKVNSTGLATLRRDGFASMDAGGKQGTLTTRRVIFKGSHLFVNLKAPKGALRVQALDADGTILATSHQVTGDKTLIQVGWEDRADLSALAGKPVRFRFLLSNGSLFAFWVSRDESGRSDGYVGGGGPGYPGTLDTVGRAAFRH